MNGTQQIENNIIRDNNSIQKMEQIRIDSSSEGSEQVREATTLQQKQKAEDENNEDSDVQLFNSTSQSESENNSQSSAEWQVEDDKRESEDSLIRQNENLNEAKEVQEKDRAEKKQGYKLLIRQPQMQLFRNSVDTNRIVYLPTGMGKTRVAICSMYYYLCKYGTGRKIAFLANTVQLVKQQSEAIRRTLLAIIDDKVLQRELRASLADNYTPLSWNQDDISAHVACIHGEKSQELGLSTRKTIQGAARKALLKSIDKSTVIVIISQMFLNLLRKGSLRLADFSLLVFDECHHAFHNHPFAAIMKQFYYPHKINNESIPIIMGLTASPLSKPLFKSAQLSKQLRALCTNLDSTFAPYQMEHNKAQKLTKVEILCVTQPKHRLFVPQLMDYVKRFKSNAESLQKIIKYFPEYAECVEQVLQVITKASSSLAINAPLAAVDAEWNLFYDLRDCLLNRLRDIWLQLGQYTFCLALEDMKEELMKFRKVFAKLQEKKQLLENIIDILNRHQLKLKNKYGECKRENFSGKVNKLIDILNESHSSEVSLENKEILRKLCEKSTQTNQLSDNTKKMQNKEEQESILNTGRQDSKEETIKDLVLVFAFERRTVFYLQKTIEKYKAQCKEGEKERFNSVGVTGYAGNQSVRRRGRQEVTILEQPSNENSFLKYSQIWRESGEGGAREDLPKVLLQIEEKYSTQMQKLINFKKKKFRILITTSVTEEGFDIPSCNLVISFNEPTSITSYIQVKGRARQQNSHYCILTYEGALQSLKENVCTFDASIELTYKLAIEEEGVSIKKEKFKQDPEYSYRMVKSTGAILNTNNAREILKAFLSTLPLPNYCGTHYFQVPGIGYKCLLFFPSSCPSKTAYVAGECHPTKNAALKSAAFHAALLLKKEKLLNDELRPYRQDYLDHEFQFERFEDLAICHKDPAYRHIFIRHVRIRTADDKPLKFYFSTVPSELLFNVSIPNHFQTAGVRLKLNLYRLFYSKHKENQGIGFICHLPIPEFQQSFKENFGEKYWVNSLGAVEIHKDQYNRLKKVHEFLVISMRNKDLWYYSWMCGKAVHPGWQNSLERAKEEVTWEQKWETFPLVVPLVMEHVDWQTVHLIQQHIVLMKQLYAHNNRAAKLAYNDALATPLAEALTLRRTLFTADTTVILQNISPESSFCFKGIARTKRTLSQELLDGLPGEQKTKLVNKRKKYKTFLGMEKEFNLVGIESWRDYEKQEMGQLLDRKQNIRDIMKEYSSFLWQEFIPFPISPHRYLLCLIACKYAYQSVHDYHLALHFQNHYLNKILTNGRAKAQTIPNQTLHVRPSAIIKNASAVFGALARNSHHGTKILNTLNKSLDISSVASNHNNSISDLNISDVFNTTKDFNKKEMYQDSIRILPHNENSFTHTHQQNLHLTTFSLPPAGILKALTSQMVTSNKKDNLEEYEFIGDCVLKTLATIEVYLLNPQAEESALHLERVKIISNRNLHQKAIEKKLFEYVRASTQMMNVPPFCIQSNGVRHPTKYKDTDILLHDAWSEMEGFQEMPGKMHADALEAINGLVFVHFSQLPQSRVNDAIDRCQQLLFAFGVLSRPQMKPIIHIQPFSVQMPLLYGELEVALGYVFTNKSLFLQALTHSSVRMIAEEVAGTHQLSQILDKAKNTSFNASSFLIQEKSPHHKYGLENHDLFYERLEFLGDSLLDLIVVEYIMEGTEKEHDEGKLSNMKQSAVCNKALGLVALQLGLHRGILLDTPDTEKAMRNFKELSEALPRLMRNANEVLHLDLTALKLLGDVLEATVGAIFIDVNMDYAKCKSIVMRFMGEDIARFTSPAYMEKSTAGNFQRFLKANKYEKCNIIKDYEADMVDGKYKFLLVDKYGNDIDFCFETNEKRARELFQEKVIQY